LLPLDYSAAPKLADAALKGRRYKSRAKASGLRHKSPGDLSYKDRAHPSERVGHPKKQKQIPRRREERAVMTLLTRESS
jgi:hypothetical protein